MNRAPGRLLSCILVLCILVFCTLFGFRDTSQVYTTPEVHRWHPIPQLMSSAEANFTNLLSGQSTTLKEAVAEYRRRYNRNPPKGFDDWFAFAMENDAKIIDLYDSMIEDFSPFWNLTGDEMRRRVLQVGQLPSIDLVRLENGKTVTLNITKPNFHDGEGHARARGFRVMMEKFQHKLPDMDFAINARAEGRVLVSWEHKTYTELAPQSSSPEIQKLVGGKFTADWKGDGNVWEAFRRTCHPSSQARRLFGSLRGPSHLGSLPAQKVLPLLSQDLSDAIEDPDFDFTLRPDDDFDFCSQTWARYLQGHLFSDWRTIPALYPVFSPAKAPGYSDILIPSHYYYTPSKEYTYGWDREKKIINDTDKSEVAWENKTDRIFWRGATTGGGSSPAGFLRSYQRHRFIDMAASQSNVSKTVIFPDPHTSEITRVTVPIRTLNADITDVAFTKAVGCVKLPGGCKDILEYYRFTDPVPMSELWRHKYLIDIDGMGYSARAMALLASESALVKATVYREFYTDWIQPWLHYIPLSQTYKELYNIHAFFSGPSQSMLKAANLPSRNTSNSHGDELLQRIAGAGREWKRTIGRKVDMEVYVYRLCLEYARLWADDRDAMSYTGPP